MIIPFIEFIESLDDEAIINAFVELFYECEGSYSQQEAINNSEMLIQEFREAYYTRKEIIQQDVNRSKNKASRFIFSTVISDASQCEHDKPIVDISLMNYASLKEIPNYMSNRPVYIDYEDLNDDTAAEDIAQFVYEKNILSFPILLTSLDELMHYDVYIPEGNMEYASVTAASLIYGIAIFGDCIEMCENKKQEISHNILQTAKNVGFEDNNVDEILQYITGEIDPKEYDDDELFGKMMIDRYNARMNVYDRIYCDLMVVSKYDD